MLATPKSIIDNKEITKIDNRYIDRLHSTILSKLQDDTYDKGFTHKIVKSGFSEADIMNVIEYCLAKATYSKGRAFVKIFSIKMSGGK